MTINKETGQLIGRGSTDDKGPLLAWINVLQAHHDLGLELPVNIRLCFEGLTKYGITLLLYSSAATLGMEESGSEGLEDLINAEKGPGGFFDGIDCACIVRYNIPSTPSSYLTSSSLIIIG